MSTSLKPNLLASICAGMLTTFCVIDACAQGLDSDKCRGPVYTRKEVTTPAKMIGDPDFSAVFKAFGNGVSAHVKLEAVLCRSGQVTEIHIIDSQPIEVGEWVAKALSLVSFKAAELNWHTVSQKQQFEFNLNPPSVPLDSAAAVGRLVEELEIVGNRRMEKEEILNSIKTRPGDPYNAAQVEADLKALLKTGRFNASGTRVTLEDTLRGGVRVIFEVFELPLIARISFDDLAGATNSAAILNEFAKQHIDLAIGKPFDPVNLKKANKAIEDYFRAQGWINVKAEAAVQSLMPTEVKITFKITGTNF